MSMTNIMTVVAELRQLDPRTVIPGLSKEITSYRGRFEDVAIVPGAGVRASTLANTLANRVGKVQIGYKGGEYEVTPRSQVFVAEHGDMGGRLVGFYNDGRPDVIHD